MSAARNAMVAAIAPGIARAIENALIAEYALTKWVTQTDGARGAPPFTATLAEGLAHYGGAPSASYDLWVGWRGLERLRAAWESEPVPDDPPVVDEPDASRAERGAAINAAGAPGLTVEAPPPIDEETDKQQRLVTGDI